MINKILKITLPGIFVLAAVVMAGCGGNSENMVEVNGSTTVSPVAQAWAETFNEKNSGASVMVTGTGSGNGIAALINGTTDIAMTSRKISEKERDQVQGEAKEFAVARDALAVIVNNSNPVDNLTMEQLKGIYTGEITNWEEVGGPDERILVYNRDSSSGTYTFFKKAVLEGEEYTKNSRKTGSNSNLVKSVAQEENAIGYIGIAFLNNEVKAVALKEENKEPVKPTMETAKNGNYPLVRDLNMYTIGEPQGTAKDYLEFGLSEEGQSIVEEIGYVPVQ